MLDFSMARYILMCKRYMCAVFFWPFQSVSIFNLIFQVNVLGLCGRVRMNVCRDSNKQSVWWHMNIQRCSVSLRAQQHSEHSFYVFHYYFRRILSILCAKRLLFIHFRLFRFFSLSQITWALLLFMMCCIPLHSLDRMGNYVEKNYNPDFNLESAFNHMTMLY